MPEIGKPKEPNLPPPGYKRVEELAKRTDQLQEAAETKMPEAYSMPTDALKPDRELQYAMQEFSMHEVTNKQPGFMYSWCYTGQHGTEITMKRARGWVVVQGTDVEAKELEHVDTTRRLGDCILMKISQEKYDKIQQYEEYVRSLKQGAGDEEVKELGRKLGLNVEVDSPDIIKRFGGNTPAQMVITQGAMDSMLRQGTVPGVKPGSDMA